MCFCVTETFKYQDNHGYPMRKIELKKETLTLTDKNILGFIEKEVTPVGNSAKVDCPKRFIGKRAYVIIVK